MPQPSVLFATGRVWAMLDRLLTRERMARLLEAADAADVLRQLADTDYGALASELAHPSGFETMLMAETMRVWALVEELSSDQHITDAFGLRYDAHNLKVLFKARLLDKEYDTLLLPGRIPIEPLKALVRDGDGTALPDAYKSGLLELYGLLAVEPTSQRIAVAIDRWYFANALSLLTGRAYDRLRTVLTAQIDFANIGALLRVKAMGGDERLLDSFWIAGGVLDAGSLIAEPIEGLLEELRVAMAATPYAAAVAEGLDEYARTKRTSGLERRLDDWQLEWIRQKRNDADTPLPLLGYLFAKEREITDLRLILTAKLGGVATEGVRERLRGLYV